MEMAQAWRAMAPGPIRCEDEFVAWLDRVGLCMWRPIPRLAFPNLADMMDLAKPDDIWDTWFWKDDLHEAKRLFYGKLLGGSPTFVSMELLPPLIAARGDVDPYTFHEQGRLTADAIRIYDALVRCRQLTTTELRVEAGLMAKASKAAFDSAVTALGALFQICKVGITGRTRGTYGYRWGLVEDWAPEALAKAARLRPEDGARQVASRLRAMGVVLEARDWKRLFGWDDEIIEAATTGV
ncbi:MAG: winged helix DNA-binding domain-containing protein [Chthonomonadales bacterium]|nr:winged helix DNA-binding domain-containing protein [Chthonomonadales bacterium]